MIIRTRTLCLSLCCAFSSALITAHCADAPLRTISAEKIDQSVFAALSHNGNARLKVISHIDLTDTFRTAAQWTFVAVEDDSEPPSGIEEHGPIHLCLVKMTSPDCSESFYSRDNSDQPSSDTPYQLLASSIVYGGQNNSNPLLHIKVCGKQSFNGNCGIATALYRYDKRMDRFTRVFLNLTGRNNNQATRFVEYGPLQGGVIVAYPTDNRPYTYWIEFYRAGAAGKYTQILRYRGHTGYGDGNPLAVADSEMPELLGRLGLWHPGDPLPVPAHMPQRCSHLFLKNGEEWCK